MQAMEFVAYLRSRPSYQGQICHVEHLPSRGASFADPGAPLPAPLERTLASLGISGLYTHQADALRAVREGHHIAVTTSTASGKTLCYNLPVLERLLEDPNVRALYLFPTKALAQDQLRTLAELADHSCPGLRFATYDGDTPQSARSRIRKSASIILSNPDMLHVAILPNHRLWSDFLANLRYVVLDEAHVYRGVFGSHVACILRRLRRLCRRYGSEPIFICSSATVANPAEHLENLTGLCPVVISEDGSPRGPRDFVLWNPPLVDEKRGRRRSANVEAARLFTELVSHNLRNITFTKARKVAELILRYGRQMLDRRAPTLVPLIRSYRAGYTARERREIEQSLFQGELLGVTATTALELGVDIGALDATVLVGYPGTIASTWQQAGRAGRGERHALSFLIGLDNPLDQYFMRHPAGLFGRSPENALLDPGNKYVLAAHLPCAAYEAPLAGQDVEYFGQEFSDTATALLRAGRLKIRGDRWYYPWSDYPAEGVSIRSMSQEAISILDESQGNALLEEVEGATAPARVHPGAIYLHQGEGYLIKELDLNLRVAFARPTDVSYYTQPKEINELAVAQTWREQAVGSSHACYGQVEVSEQVIGFRRKALFTDQLLGEEQLDLPPHSFLTAALWFDVPPAVLSQMSNLALDVQGALHALEHAAIGILPLFAMCDRQDIGGLSTPHHSDTGQAQVFIYDAFPGGVGISEKGYELLPELWDATLRTIVECPCEDGCPSCIHSPKCGNNNEPLDKRGAEVILKALLSGL